MRRRSAETAHLTMRAVAETKIQRMSPENPRRNDLFVALMESRGLRRLSGGGCSPVKPVSTAEFPFITEFNREFHEILRFRASSGGERHRSLSTL